MTGIIMYPANFTKKSANLFFSLYCFREKIKNINIREAKEANQFICPDGKFNVTKIFAKYTYKIKISKR
jgi:hypothetical protein